MMRASLPRLLLLLPALGCSASGGGGSGGSGAVGAAGSSSGGSGALGGTGGSASGGAQGGGTIGDGCTSDDDCTDPPDAECFQTIGGGPVPTITFPGGYCSKGCDTSEDDQCGTTGGCASSGMSGGRTTITLTMCVAPCKDDTECRQAEGYVCRQIIPGVGYCALP